MAILQVNKNSHTLETFWTYFNTLSSTIGNISNVVGGTIIELLNTVIADVGNKTSLNTINKTNIVSAINEMKGANSADVTMNGNVLDTMTLVHADGTTETITFSYTGNLLTEVVSERSTRRRTTTLEYDGSNYLNTISTSEEVI